MNPFVAHRQKVLGSYGTAAWLRQAVLCMWSGSDHSINLSRLGEVDEAHFGALVEMLGQYRRHGQNDPAFMTLVQECLQQLDDERAAEAREQLLGTWCREVKAELRKLGLDAGEVDDRYAWFEDKFDAGCSPAQAAGDARTLPPLS